MKLSEEIMRNAALTADAVQRLEARVAVLKAERDDFKAEAIRRGKSMAFPGGVDPLTVN